MNIPLKLCALILAAHLVGCNRDNAEMIWHEEAMPDDGSIVMVTQVESGLNVARNVPGMPTMGYYPPKVQLVDPKTGKTITWFPRNLPRLLPFALHIDDQVPYLFAEFYLEFDYGAFGCPIPPYIVFRWDTDHWTRIRFDALPKKFKRRNLFPTAREPLVTSLPHDKISPNEILKADQIARELSHFGQPADPAEPRTRYRRKIQHEDIGVYSECNGHKNLSTKYDVVELR